MKILLLSPWNNNWLKYQRRYFEAKGHDVIVSDRLSRKVIETCDALVCNWSGEYARILGANTKACMKYVLFCRSYELFYGQFAKVNKKNFDHIVFVNKEFRDTYYPEGEYIPNCIDLEEYPLQEHSKSNNVAMLANINHKKGIELFVQVATSYPDLHFHVAGKIQEERYRFYLNQLESQLKNVTFYDYVYNIQEWLLDKDYLLLTSAVEGHPNCIIEGMAMGLMPIVHRYPGAVGQWPHQYIWTKLRYIRDIVNSKFDSKELRQHIVDNYDYKKVYQQLEELVCH